MATKTFKSGEPLGDPSRHLPLAALESAWAGRSASARDEGRLSLIVRRLDDGRRESLERVRLDLALGVSGDDWSRRPPRDPEAQLAVMEMSVARLIANGQALTTFGDNLFVELDLSAANLPTGTRLAVGPAIVEVTPKPHNGCSKFDVRFGNDALKFVQSSATRHQNRRGIYWKVVTAGEIAMGDPIRVLSRP